MLNPNIRNVRFTAPRIFDRKSMGASKILGHLEKSLDPNVEFPYDSSSLNANESQIYIEQQGYINTRRVEFHILDSLDDTHAIVVRRECHANDVAPSN